MQDLCHMNFVIDLSHCRVSVAQWKKASEHRIWRIEVRFLMGTQKFFYVSCLWQEEKTTSSKLKFVMFWDTLASILEFDTSSLIGTQKISLQD